MAFSIIIPSKTASNLIPCIQAIARNEPSLAPERIIVVDDGVDITAEEKAASGCRFVQGVKPFIFARNCNIGIRAAGGDDVILLNDDALLETPGGFTALAAVARKHPECGVTSAAVNSAGNPNQFKRPGTALRSEPRMVCFICVYIPRRVIDKVGLLDERYVNYGADDDDYCFTARAEGYKIGVFDGCTMDHLSLRSTFRGDPKTPADYHPNLGLFKKKWGHDNWGRVTNA
jgi:GT2 family glycosyltransferase